MPRIPVILITHQLINRVMNKYYVVFKVNYSNAIGQALAMRMDINDKSEHLKGFDTKRALIDWIETNKEGIEPYQMLKPID